MAAYEGYARPRRRLPEEAPFRLPGGDDPNCRAQFRLRNPNPRPEAKRARVEMFDARHRSSPFRPPFDIRQDRPDATGRSPDAFLTLELAHGSSINQPNSLKLTVLREERIGKHISDPSSTLIVAAPTYDRPTCRVAGP